MCTSDCLLMNSGGRDSLLSACRLLRSGYRLNLITFDNGCELGIENALSVSKDLISIWKESIITTSPVVHVAGAWRNFFLPIYNMKPSEIINEYGELTISQLNCLTCRTAMYIHAVQICHQKGICYIAEGARRCQRFAIQQDAMINNYRHLLEKYNIDLITPVYEVYDDWELKNELLSFGLIPKTKEPQCLIGVPLKNELDKDVLDAVNKFFNKVILPRANAMIDQFISR